MRATQDCQKEYQWHHEVQVQQTKLMRQARQGIRTQRFLRNGTSEGIVVGCSLVDNRKTSSAVGVTVPFANSSGNEQSSTGAGERVRDQVVYTGG